MISVTGSMVFLADGLANFSSQLQNITAQSTTKSELIAMNTCTKQGLYLSRIPSLSPCAALHFVDT